jgi:hypothetical protein
VSLPRADEFPPSERDPVELELLSMGHEDVYGLWEILGGVDSALDVGGYAHVLRLAQAVVLDLLERGLYELRHGHELENKPGDLVPAGEREAVLGDLASWDAHARGEDDPYYTVTGTPQGVEEYYRRVAGGAREDAPDRTGER